MRKSRPARVIADRKFEARSAVNAASSTGDEAGLHASGFESREIQQRIDELEQTHAVAMSKVDQRRIGVLRPGVSRENVLERSQHQRERRPELVADVREEHRLGAVDLRQRLRAQTLLLVGARVGVRGCDLSGEQVDETAVGAVERAIRVDADDQEPACTRLPLLRKRHDDGLARRNVPVTAAATRRISSAGRRSRDRRRCATGCSIAFVNPNRDVAAG